MTFFHFVNCIALCFGPSYVVFEACKLNQVGAYSTVVMGAVGYILSQLAKLVLVAMLVPEREWLLEVGGGVGGVGGVVGVVGGMEEGEGRVRVLQELVKQVVSMVELVGVWWVVRGSKSGAEVRVVGSAVGWSFALNLFSRFLPLFFQARQLDFSWEHTLSSLYANLSLLSSVSVCACVWMWNKKKGGEEGFGYIYFYLAAVFSSLLPFLFSLASAFLNDWLLFFLSLLSTGALSFYTLHLFSKLN